MWQLGVTLACMLFGKPREERSESSSSSSSSSTPEKQAKAEKKKKKKDKKTKKQGKKIDDKLFLKNAQFDASVRQSRAKLLNMNQTEAFLGASDPLDEPTNKYTFEGGSSNLREPENITNNMDTALDAVEGDYNEKKHDTARGP